MNRKTFVEEYLAKGEDKLLPEKTANYVYSLFELGNFLMEKNLLVDAFRAVPEFEDTFYKMQQLAEIKAQKERAERELEQAQFYKKEMDKGYDDEDEPDSI